MQKQFRLNLPALLLVCALAMSATLSRATTCATDYVVIEDLIMYAVPNHYMQASSVQVTVKTNTGYTASQQTTPGATVNFNLPDGSSRITVESKYKVGADYIIIIEVIDR